ncbi:MAG TPA: transposase [Paraburkholderia sp.]|uniref:transposase n=1 Tax=Paraburkholderia sp. TaxID=1926495 RepID=UPI002B479F74|nr:transposase [Paraburkholderia sp.]HKR42075.1 transposase [Paraburkholderia sp.]
MQFEEISNEEWSLVGPILNGEHLVGILRRGRPRVQTRVVANAVLWVLTTGEAWSKLPAQYPSQQTCRCRFDEWLQNGKLAEMIRMLSNTGRRFRYIPDEPQSNKKPEAKRHVCVFGVSGLPRVVWRSQESWHASSADKVDRDSHVAALAGTRQVHDAHSRLAFASNDARVPEHLMPTVGRDYQQGAFWMGLTAKGSRVADKRGFVIYVAADMVRGEMFRGWAEIMRDGKRIGRSGLVGPRFVAQEAAKQCAMDWAHRWIEHFTCAEYDQLQCEVGAPTLGTRFLTA